MEPSVNIPAHVAIIMDGNGRWAEERGRERIFGHMNGVESVRRAVRASVRNGVRYLTLYAFSTENWGRPAEEVDALMDLMCTSLVREADELRKEGVRFVMIGDQARLSDKLRMHLAKAEEATRAGETLTLTIALNYSSRWEITRMVQRIARQVHEGAIMPNEITAATVEAHLATAGYPNPDLLIRTGGNHRLSNFMLWQLAYSELYFTDTYWPDFSEKDFDKAVESFQQRERRFGLVNQPQ